MLKLENLVKSLLEQDLNKFRFCIFSRINNEKEVQYTYAVKGSVPIEDSWSLITFVGGNPEIEYTKEYLINKIKEI